MLGQPEGAAIGPHEEVSGKRRAQRPAQATRAIVRPTASGESAMVLSAALRPSRNSTAPSRRCPRPGDSAGSSDSNPSTAPSRRRLPEGAGLPLHGMELTRRHAGERTDVDGDMQGAGRLQDDSKGEGRSGERTGRLAVRPPHPARLQEAVVRRHVERPDARVLRQRVCGPAGRVPTRRAPARFRQGQAARRRQPVLPLAEAVAGGIGGSTIAPPAR
jgi:hypothetical protein